MCPGIQNWWRLKRSKRPGFTQPDHNGKKPEYTKFKDGSAVAAQSQPQKQQVVGYFLYAGTVSKYFAAKCARVRQNRLWCYEVTCLW